MSGPILVSKEAYSASGKQTPVTLGHEFSGTIEEVGKDVKGLLKGQRAVVRPTIFDEKCPACKNGNRHCCENIRFIGLSGMILYQSLSSE
jgi:threonine dehydrogenase-like Zn-dependent dehydrogenase